MKYFLSCDWGTSSFRIRLAAINDGAILAEKKSEEGIARTFSLWQEIGNPDPGKRVSFYLDIVKPHIKAIEEKINQSLTSVKLIISGMASSSIGIMDIPYASAPVGVNGAGINTGFIASSENFEHDVLIISGIKTSDDVMRGEETQLIGCIDATAAVKNELYIFPGTHSKHILVKDNQVADIKTYMTGEVFELLSKKSILKNSVEINDAPGDLTNFRNGVRDAMDRNLLHSVFKVRTNQLFNVCTKPENFNYLSGLLIGAELSDLKTTEAGAINLICGTNLQNYYYSALTELGFSNTVNTFAAQWVDEAAVRGQLKIAGQLNILA